MNNMVKISKKLILFILIWLVCFSQKALAINYMGIEFPYGALSFADEVVSYTVGENVTAPYNDPSKSLGIPDQGQINSPEFWNSFVSLGDGGTLIVKFTDNFVTPSGDTNPDLWIFEAGKRHEQFSASISKNGFDWFYIGVTQSREQTGFNIDGVPGIGYRQLYYYVKLVDMYGRASSHLPGYAGADIDAVGAISAKAPDPDPEPVPEPAALLLISSGLLGMIGTGRKKISW
ncbi:MAG: PEP-CTERM sorting domain-containing protein [Candidatus Schekmanbacteria bacterium]|nr:PEP-CTERM sorting domain-containing protein [Candidatus Schekmanbacteria bacterium]